jgi:ATP synthase I chain
MMDLARAEARLPRWMFGLGAAATAAAAFIAGPRFAAGLALGVALGILNFRWLHHAVRGLAAASEGRVPRSVLAKFVVRYPLVLAGLYLVYKTGWLPATAILAGLFVPVAGILAEAILQIATGWRPTTEN